MSDVSFPKDLEQRKAIKQQVLKDPFLEIFCKIYEENSVILLDITNLAWSSVYIQYRACKKTYELIKSGEIKL